MPSQPKIKIVQNDIDHSTDHLRQHGEDSLARGLQHAFKAELRKETERAHQTDAAICSSVGDDLCIRSLDAVEQLGKQIADDSKQDGIHKNQKYAHACALLKVALPLCTQ